MKRKGKKQLNRELLRHMKPDNRGAALVLVLIAIGMVLILVSVLMSISYLNYQMKVTEKKSKDSFYSAEIIMDQIHAGLEQVVSEAANSAYTTAMQTYKTGIYTESERTKNFRTQYLTQVRNKLQEGSSDSRYDAGTINESYVSGTVTESNRPYVSGLATFLDDALQLTAYKTAQGGTGTLESLAISCAEPAASNSLVWSDEGLTLKKLLVQYTDPDGYYTEIQTDIRIGFPQVSLGETSTLPDVMDYALIADQAIAFESGANVTVSSSVYAGAKETTASGETKEQSILVTGADITFDDATYIVAEGDIDVEQGSLTVQDGTLWAHGICVIGAGTKGTAQTSSTLTLDTTAHIADDLTTSKYNVTVKLGGKYYGYGGAESGRSAILVNSANTTLDLSGLSDLLLNGAAYLNGSSISTTSNGTDTGDVLLGTSVAMKTDQIAFLAPAECLGTDTAGNVLIGQNPMSAAAATTTSLSTYQEWLATDVQLNVDKKTELLGYPLSHYGLSDSDYQTIFQTVGGEAVCYVYLKFQSENQAAEYYRDYMAKANDKMKTYMSKYGNTITGLSGSVYSIRGNLLTYSLQNNTVAIVENTIDGLDDTEKAELDTRVSKYEQSFAALCSKLTTNQTALSADELAKSVYENLIDTSALDALNGELTYSAAGKTAIVTDNAGGSALKVGSASDNADCALVVASGDVEVRGDFSGTIIAGGTVTVNAVTGGTIQASSNVVKQLLQEKDADGTTLVARFFVNGEQYALDQDSGTTTDYVSLESVISYVNWSKQ